MDPEIVKRQPGKCPKCGMRLEIRAERLEVRNGEHHSMEEDFKRRFFITLPVVVFVMLLSPNIQKWLGLIFDFEGRNFLLFLLGTFIFFFGGLPFFKAARGEISTRNFGMMTLVALAITVGYSFSVAATFLFPGESLYWEISTLIAVFLLGHWLEMRAVRGATGALAELAKLIPPIAHKIARGPVAGSFPAFAKASAGRPASDEALPAPFDGVGSPPTRSTPRFEVTDVNTEELVKGDWVLVKPGEKVPIDGVVKEGESAVNESMITGESNPVEKKAGSEVIGGTINADGSLTVEVTKTGEETAVAQIMELIRQAQTSKPKVQELADRAANVLTIVAIAVGVTTFIFWFFVSPSGAIFAATLAVSVVVVACPHALGLAIPTVTTITSTLGARNGILIKDMKGLEIARKLDYVVFDKTGTLTKGEFGVVDIVAWGPVTLAGPAAYSSQGAPASLSAQGRSANADARLGSPLLASPAAGATPRYLLSLAAAVETHSQHSLALGIVNEAKKRGVRIPAVKNFKSYPGKGAEGMVNSKRVVAGNKILMEELGIRKQESGNKNHNSLFIIHDSITMGKTVVYVAVDGKLVGQIILADVIREESKEAVDRLHKMGIKTAMLTGDIEEVAQEVGKELGIDTVFAEVLPEQKVEIIKKLQGLKTRINNQESGEKKKIHHSSFIIHNSQPHVVAFVGDGVNDAPSLTQAHLGIAIGAGTDVAVESAQIVLVKNDPRDVVKAISLSRKTNSKMVQNLVWATGYNVLAIPTAAGLFYPPFGLLLRPEWAAILMSLSSIIVVFNALLLRREKL